MKTEQCESFFNFFSPPQVPEDEEDIDEDAVSIFIFFCVNFLEVIDEDAVNGFIFFWGSIWIIFSLFLLWQAEELQGLMEQDYDIG